MNLADQEVPAATTELASLVSKKLVAENLSVI